MPFLLNKDRRIRKTSQYKTIYESGEKRVGKLLLFFYGKPGWHESRVGITVSGKVGKAYQTELGQEKDQRGPFSGT